MSSARLAALALTCLLAATFAPAAAEEPAGTYTANDGASCTATPCPLWTAQHAAPDGMAAMRTSVLSHDGKVVYTAGGTFSWANSTDLGVWAVSVDDGRLLWSANYDGPTNAGEKDLWLQDVRHLALSPDGSRLVLAGASQAGFGFGYDIVTISYDTTTGQQLWAQRENGPDRFDDTAFGVAIDATGTYVVTVGESLDADGVASWNLIGYGLATGTRLWQQMLRSPCGDALPFGAAPGPGRTVFVGGITGRCLSATTTVAEEGLAWVPAMGALDAADGTIAWWVEDLDPLHIGQSAILRGTLHAAGDRVFLSSMITNPRNPSGDLDVLTMATDTGGDVQWRTRYDSGGYDELKGGAVSPDGQRLYHIAASPGLATTGIADQNQDLVVYAQDGATGQRLWTTRLDGSDPGLAGEGAALGEDDESAPLIVPALFAGGDLLVLGYRSFVESADPLGPVGTGSHRLSILSTSDGGVVALRQEQGELREYAYTADHDRSDFVGAGDRGRGFAFEASLRRFTVDIEPPVLALPTPVVAEATGPHGAAVAYQARATDNGEDVAVTCTPASGTFPLGTTPVHCTATDLYGNTATGSFDVTVQDTTPPHLAVPAALGAPATSSAGAEVSYAATAEDLVDGAVAVACTPPSGAALPLGATSILCSAVDAAGNHASTTIDATVTYRWSGWRPPVAADGTSTFQHGRTVPVVIQLTHESAGIEDAKASLWIASSGPEEAAVGKDGSNGFTYDPKEGNYTFHWETGSVPPGAYRLRIDLGDGTWNVTEVVLG